ncbi:hypothetical protein [Thalassomonas sp. M1454]|uniref:hypothetical protein n=1 Tax=Thalassomonas sp. M1454 TaxID=2594477 RepID=UPI00117E6D9D|nr:hypothetical protein [Thalassomonas sp. M1454]TRX56679.1 hypothetical protein FNN08_03895 [Thalassomonas sp. M1454]
MNGLAKLIKKPFYFEVQAIDINNNVVTSYFCHALTKSIACNKALTVLTSKYGMLTPFKFKAKRA